MASGVPRDEVHVHVGPKSTAALATIVSDILRMSDA
jgi:hypothetical protein